MSKTSIPRESPSRTQAEHDAADQRQAREHRRRMRAAPRYHADMVPAHLQVAVQLAEAAAPDEIDELHGMIVRGEIGAAEAWLDEVVPEAQLAAAGLDYAAAAEMTEADVERTIASAPAAARYVEPIRALARLTSAPARTRAVARSRARSRSPRVARRAAKASPSSSSDPPAEPPPLRAAAVAAATIVLTDAPAMALVLAAVVGLTPRQLRDLVVERGIPHATWRRHVYVRLDAVVRALGLGDAPDAPASSPRAVDEDAIVHLAARGRR